MADPKFASLCFLMTIFWVLLPPATVEAADIRDIKGPLAYGWNPSLCLIVGLFFILLIGLIGFVIKRRKGHTSFPLRPAHEIAYEALDRLQKKDLPGKGRFQDYYVELSETLRKYLQCRYGYGTPGMTPEELLMGIDHSIDLSPQQSSLLRGFFRQCDLVKFGHYRPPLEETDRSLETGRDIIRRTKEGAPV